MPYARNNRNFVNRISARVIAATSACPASWYAVFFFSSSDKIQDLRSTPHQHFVLGISKVGHQYEFAILPRRPQSSFVGQAFKVRARESRCAARDDREIHVVRNRFFCGWCTRRISRGLHVRPRDNHSPVERPGRSNAGSSTIRPRWLRRSGSRLRLIQIVHFRPATRSRSVAFIVAPAKSSGAMASDCIDSSIKMMQGAFFSPVQQVGARGSRNADQTFRRIRTRNRKTERSLRSAIARASKVLPSLEARQQDALGKCARQASGIFADLSRNHNFLQLFLGFIRFRNILKRHLLLLRRKQPPGIYRSSRPLLRRPASASSGTDRNPPAAATATRSARCQPIAANALPSIDQDCFSRSTLPQVRCASLKIVV